MTNPRITSLIAAVRSLSSRVDSVSVQLRGEVTWISICAYADEDAALMAQMLGADRYDTARANGNEWVEYTSAEYWAADVRIQVTGPHRRAGMEVVA